PETGGSGYRFERPLSTREAVERIRAAAREGIVAPTAKSTTQKPASQKPATGTLFAPKFGQPKKRAGASPVIVGGLGVAASFAIATAGILLTDGGSNSGL